MRMPGYYGMVLVELIKVFKYKILSKQQKHYSHFLWFADLINLFLQKKKKIHKISQQDKILTIN